MKYQSIGEALEFASFETLNKKQAEEYFQWYLKQIEGRIEQLGNKSQLSQGVKYLASVMQLVAERRLKWN